MNIDTIVLENRLLENDMIILDIWYITDYDSIMKTMIRFYPVIDDFIFPASLLNIEFEIFIPHAPLLSNVVDRWYSITFIFEKVISLCV